MPKVSIIVPVYNAEKCIERCIESVISQDYDDWELILVNDGSKDRSKEILDEYAMKDERIKVIHKANSGVSSTRNRGISEAKGSYIQFMDADDWLPNDAVKILLREMEGNAVDMVIGDFYRVVEDSVSKKGSIGNSGIISRKEYADEMMLTPADFYYGVLWNKLYKKSIIDEYNIRMDINISYCEDMIFNLEYLLHVKDIYVLTTPVYYYVKTKGSLVEKGMNIPSIIEMKTNVITYYNNFYKNILDEMSYLERMPIIYGYLIAISTDAFSIPFLNATKLGKEKGEALYLNDEIYSSLLMNNYLSDSLLDYYLNSLAQKYNMDIKDIKVLYCLSLVKNEMSVDQIASYCNLSKVIVIATIAKLAAKGYIQMKIMTEGEMIVVKDVTVIQDFEQIENDCDKIRFKDFSSEEQEQYRLLQKKMTKNIENFLK